MSMVDILNGTFKISTTSDENEIRFDSHADSDHDALKLQSVMKAPRLCPSLSIKLVSVCECVCVYMNIYIYMILSIRRTPRIKYPESLSQSFPLFFEIHPFHSVDYRYSVRLLAHNRSL